MSEANTEKTETGGDAVIEFMESLCDLVGRKITGAAYSERDGDPIIILNLVNSTKVCTSWYMPLDLRAFMKKSEGE